MNDTLYLTEEVQQFYIQVRLLLMQAAVSKFILVVT